MSSNLVVTVDFDFFVYRNPAWTYALPIDAPASAEAWKQRVGFLYHAAGQNIRVKSNVVAVIDGVEQVQPSGFVDHLAKKNVTIPAGVPLYVSDYRKLAFSAVAKIVEKTGKPVELLHFGTAHGFRPYDKRNGSADSTCSDSWHTWMVTEGLVSKVTLVFPEWQRKFADLDRVGLKDADVERLPANHPPISEMFLNDWSGFSQETPVAGFFGARQGGLVGPWLDQDYLDFLTDLPGDLIKHIGDPVNDPKPQIPRGWTDTPPDAAEIERMKAAPKQTIDQEDPSGIYVLYNGRPVQIR